MCIIDVFLRHIQIHIPFFFVILMISKKKSIYFLNNNYIFFFYYKVYIEFMEWFWVLHIVWNIVIKIKFDESNNDLSDCFVRWIWLRRRITIYYLNCYYKTLEIYI